MKTYKILKMYLLFFVFSCLVQFLAGNPCKQHFKMQNGVECPLENLTNWLDNEIEILRKPPPLFTNESFDRFYFIDVTATPFDDNPFNTEMCVFFSSVDFLSSGTIDLEFSSRDEPNVKYRISNKLKLKNPKKIREMLKDPPILKLGCYRISDLFDENEQIDPTIEIKVKSNNTNNRSNKYSEFYFKLPNWRTINAGEYPDKCVPEPFIYVNSTYRNFEKIIVKWTNCSSKIDLKITKHEEKTDKQIWVEHIADVDMGTPLIFWQVKGNPSQFYYKAEVVQHLENAIPRWDDKKTDKKV